MRIISVCLCFFALAIGTPADATDTTTTTTRCFDVGMKQASRDVASGSLTAGDAGFKWLRTEFGYTLRLKGTHYKRSFAGTSDYYWYFVPERFAIVSGWTLATAGANPSGQALGSVTTFRLRSWKESAEYDLSSPWSPELGWEASKTVRTITNTSWSNAATS